MCAADLTELLHRISGGDKQAEESLFPAVFQQLRRMARARLAFERGDHTLQPTALVNELYLKLIEQSKVDWKDRAHFFRVAARSMRRILVDHARKHNAAKRSGIRIALDDDLAIAEEQCPLAENLDEALTRLEQFRPRQARVVEMRFYAGLTEQEIAETLNVDVRTVKRDWDKARAYLLGELST